MDIIKAKQIAGVTNVLGLPQVSFGDCEIVERVNAETAETRRKAMTAALKTCRAAVRGLFAEWEQRVCHAVDTALFNGASDPPKGETYNLGADLWAMANDCTGSGLPPGTPVLLLLGLAVKEVRRVNRAGVFTVQVDVDHSRGRIALRYDVTPEWFGVIRLTAKAGAKSPTAEVHAATQAKAKQARTVTA